jgi:hypothetical protein
VPSAGLWARLLSVERAVVERVDFDEDADAIVVAYGPQGYQASLRQMRAALSWLRPRPGAVALAGVGLATVRLPGGRRVQGGLPHPSGGGGPGALDPGGVIKACARLDPEDYW